MPRSVMHASHGSGWLETMMKWSGWTIICVASMWTCASATVHELPIDGCTNYPQPRKGHKPTVITYPVSIATRPRVGK
jgi:hypothetical protein